MADAVTMNLQPSSPRQLGEDGLLVFWRDGPEPGRREGLACILSVCPNPECSCELVYVDGYLLDRDAAALRWDLDGVHLDRLAGAERVRTTLDEKMMINVDPGCGEPRALPDEPDATDPALVEWFDSELDGELLEVLHRFRSRAKGYPPEGPRTDIDLDQIEESHLATVDELLEGTRSDDYLLGDRRFWAATFLCPFPDCDCHEARIVFFEEGADPDGEIGSVLIDLGGASGFKIVEKTHEGEGKRLLEELWGRFQRRHDVAGLLRRREAQLKAVGATLWRPVVEPLHVAPKPGRNAPCPCGSGKKYKKCCLGKDGEPPSPRSDR
jgi:hypothetical protein